MIFFDKILSLFISILGFPHNYLEENFYSLYNTNDTFKVN